MRKLTFTSQTLKSNNNFTMYNVKFKSSAEWMQARSWLNRWATSDFIVSEKNNHVFNPESYDRYACRIVGFRSMKDALAFSIKFSRYDDVKVWDSNELFTFVQFVE